MESKMMKCVVAESKEQNLKKKKERNVAPLFIYLFLSPPFF